MKQKNKVRIHKFYLLLKEAMPIMIFIMLIFFGAAIIGFQKDNQRILKGVYTTVSKQDETLQAIEDLAKDSKLESDEKTDIIICMLQVSIAERTPETVANCRAIVENRNTPESRYNNPTITPFSNTQTTPKSSKSGEKNDNPTSDGNTQTEQPQENRGIIERINGAIENLLGIGE